jgi:hypothetical protein
MWWQNVGKSLLLPVYQEVELVGVRNRVWKERNGILWLLYGVRRLRGIAKK